MSDTDANSDKKFVIFSLLIYYSLENITDY